MKPLFFQEGECHYNKTNIGAKDTGFVDVEQGNEQALKEAVGKLTYCFGFVDVEQVIEQKIKEAVDKT